MSREHILFLLPTVAESREKGQIGSAWKKARNSGLTPAPRAFTDYTLEDVMAAAGSHLSPFRKKNSKRPMPPWVAYLQARGCKRVETISSLIERLLPKHIHAVTVQGFE